jgi:hypothetical protein
MSRHVPNDFAGKIDAVGDAVKTARRQSRRAFTVTEEVQPGVRLVLTERAGTPVVFSLWSEARDIAELCGDGAYPATGALLAIDKPQTADLLRGHGIVVDLDLMVRSETNPGIHYALLDRVSPQRLRDAVQKLVPPGASG